MREPTLLSLFDGSGGFPLAASMCGIRPVSCSEVEPYPIAVTRSRFPGMKHLGDISKINGAEIEPVHIVSFGSPCQDLSVAGLRKGLRHEANGDEETTRSGLFMEAVRIIKEMREATHGKYPRFALWENVPGAFSSNKGEDFRVVLEELIKIVEPTATVPAPDKNGWPYADCYLGDGWSLAYRVFDAQFWGVPQRRRRIHLILDLRGECAGKVLFEREGLRGYFAEGRTPWQGAAGDAENCIGAADREGAVGSVGFPLGFRPENVLLYDEVATTLCNGTRPGVTCGVIQPVGVMASSAVNAEITDGSISPCLMARAGTGCNQLPLVACCIDGDKIGKAERAGGSGLGIRPGDKMYTLTAKDVHGVCIPINDKATRYKGGGASRNQDGSGNGLGVGVDGDPAPTLTAGDRHAVAVQTYQKVTGPLMANSHPGSYTGQDAFSDMLIAGPETAGVDCRNMNEYPEMYPTLQAKPNGGQSLNFSGAVRVRYIVRRLTPTECARLQGFADRWGDIDQKSDFSDAEYSFWLEVRNTHARINGKAEKDYTKAQMLTWYNKLLTDSSEYKMWGNGIALPPALYCMQGIVDALGSEG